MKKLPLTTLLNSWYIHIYAQSQQSINSILLKLDQPKLFNPDYPLLNKLLSILSDFKLLKKVNPYLFQSENQKQYLQKITNVFVAKKRFRSTVKANFEYFYMESQENMFTEFYF